MENDSSTIFYIIAVAVYFLYSLFFRKKEQEPAEGNPDLPDGPKKPVSFEDLLKEIRHEQGESREEAPRVEDVWEEDEYEEEHGVEETFYERPYKEDARYYEGSWESKNRYNTHATQPLVKLEDQVELTASDIVLGEVEEEEEPGRSNNRFGRLLKNPETLKDAIIVSEIFNRKHF